jgi:hypothetical protein
VVKLLTHLAEGCKPVVSLFGEWVIRARRLRRCVASVGPPGRPDRSRDSAVLRHRSVQTGPPRRRSAPGRLTAALIPDPDRKMHSAPLRHGSGRSDRRTDPPGSPTLRAGHVNRDQGFLINQSESVPGGADDRNWSTHWKYRRQSTTIRRVRHGELLLDRLWESRRSARNGLLRSAARRTQ